jgi:Ca2+-dependent lipid-binding protein
MFKSAQISLIIPFPHVFSTMLSDKTRKHKTSISRRSYNPVWNHTLVFEDVEDDGVELTLWNHDLLSHHDLLGTIRVDFDNHLWESMLARHSFWVEGVLRLT